jgi:subtilase family serine protease
MSVPAGTPVRDAGSASPRVRRAGRRRIARCTLPLAAAAGLLALAAGPGTGAATAGPATAGPATAGPATAVAATAAGARHGATAVPDLSGPIDLSKALPAPISTTDCLAQFKIRCYTPLQYHKAYDLNPLYSSGVTGAGRTIVIVDSYGSPTIAHDIAAFDKQFGLPPANLTIDKFGTIPPFNSSDSTMVSWAFETSLDVEYAHAIAPGAKIVLAETPVAETEGTTGLPQMMSAEQYLIDHGIGDVISQSFGATENTFPGFSQGNYTSLQNLRYAFTDALRHQVTVLAGSGDTGVTNYESDGLTLYPYRVNSWPSSDPLVTSVGGTQLYLDNNGNRLQPDSVWNDGYGAGGGGVSAVFPRPLFQGGVANVVGDHRGTPDISMTAAVNGAAWVYGSFPAAGGWNLVGGTSEATPVFSGVVALADQAAGHRLGWINPALYALGGSQRGLSSGLVDVTTGNNSFAGIAGYKAVPGYDLASGWGTIDANTFVRSLARS